MRCAHGSMQKVRSRAKRESTKRLTARATPPALTAAVPPLAMNQSFRPPSSKTIERLMAGLVGDVRAHAIRLALVWPEGAPQSTVSRGEIALALAGLLFEDVQRRVPMARAYVEDAVHQGRSLVFDHGALRTVAAPSGALPQGSAAFSRFLEPLGYERVGTYDLTRIGMTGYAYVHADLPESIPQYFVSELYPERFSPEFQGAVQRVVGSSRDPLSERSSLILAELVEAGHVEFDDARSLIADLVACFDRQHQEPSLNDYETLLSESAEMAWISTEGNAFNHATDRVEDVFLVSDQQKTLGRPMKESVEVSANGNVMQTAFRAATTQRLFRADEGHMVVRDVPGSFHEMITRKSLPNGSIDLTFDTGNATSIFKMTSAERTSA